MKRIMEMSKEKRCLRIKFKVFLFIICFIAGFSLSRYVVYAQSCTLEERNVLCESSDNNMRVTWFCIHAYEKMSYSIHTVDGAGGCTIYIFEVEECEKCGKRRNKELINSINYQNCPH